MNVVEESLAGKKRDGIRKYIVENFPDDVEDILLADGLDEAFLGVSTAFDGSHVAVYDIDAVMQVLEDQGMTSDEAQEYFEFNTLGAYVGPHTPIYIKRYRPLAYGDYPNFDYSALTKGLLDWSYNPNLKSMSDEENSDD